MDSTGLRFVELVLKHIAKVGDVQDSEAAQRLLAGVRAEHGITLRNTSEVMITRAVVTHPEPPLEEMLESEPRTAPIEPKPLQPGWETAIEPFPGSANE